jgi:NAD(P)-dependent dehydrogenase (short-subunit alcohol dehydrogenase family)
MNAQSKEIQEKGGNKEARDKTIRSVALGRSGKAEECADVIVYLLGDGASFITGNAVSVDGGWNC